MKFAKALLTVSFSIYILLGITLRAMSRDAVPGQRSGTSEDLSTVNSTNRDKALEGLIILYGTNENANTSVPPPPMQQLSRNGNFLTTEQSQFIVITYDGFTDEAMEAFQYAVDIWNSLIRTPVPIRIDASFTDFGGFEDKSITLGGARPADWKSGSLNLWSPEALADKRAGRDLTDGEPDIIARFNSHEEANWYFGTDGNTPSGKKDFVSTVLHEIAHGLGFFSFARVEERAIARFTSSNETGKLRGGNPDLPYIYDFFVENGSGTAIMSSTDPSFDLENQLTSNDLFWNGKKGVEANGGILPQLYAPSLWKPGSSYTHLDEITFPAGNANALMTPGLDNQEAIHNPGPITLGMLEDMGWTINKAPVFTDGSSTTRTVAVDESIGSPVVATDANNDALTYQLSGTDAAAFDIDNISGQLKTKAAYNYNTKTSYTVTVTVSDGSLIDEITVTMSVISTEAETPTNSRPSFVDGSHTNRTVPENTAKGINIGKPVAATDADNDALTYTLSGPDAAAFDIDNTTGQLKTKAELDYETKNAYTVTVTVSDGNLTVTITVIIIIIDLDDQKSPTLTLVSQPLTETSLDGSIVILSLSNRIYENWLSDPVAVSGIPGVTVKPFDVNRVSDTELAVELTFYGTDLDTDATLTFTVKADAIANYDGPDLTATAHVTANAESVVASTVTPLTETTLNGSVVTLTLNDGIYEAQYTVGNNVTVSGITGVTVNRYNVERLSETQVNVELIFDGTDFDTDTTLTFTVGANAIVGYNSAALTAQLPIIAVVEVNPKVTAFAPQPLTEATLNESTVTLTLSTGVYTQSSPDISHAIQVSGIAGVTFYPSDVVRVSDTKVTVKLTFDDTDFDTDAMLTFTVGANAIVGYNSAALTAQLPIIAVVEVNPKVTAFAPQPLTEATLNESTVTLTLSTGVYTQSSPDISHAIQVSGIAGVTFYPSDVVRVSDTKVTVKLTFDDTDFDTDAMLTFTVGADAIANYDGSARLTRIPVTAVVEERPTITAFTTQHLTEATLNGSIIRLTLNNGTYTRSNFDIDTAVTVSGIAGVTIGIFGVERVSDTEITFELEFNGNIDTNATLTFTVEADAITEYDGPALIAEIIVNGGQESIVASTETPLTETTLNGSVVTLTLNGAIYDRSTFDLRDAVEVSGIDGVTFHWFNLVRVSDTELTVELTFRGNFDTDATLTFTVGADAIAEYEGPALIAQLTVPGSNESVIAATDAPLAEATLDGSVVTLTLSGGTYERSYFRIRGAVTVSGIDGVTIGTFGVDRVSDTEITVELQFNGDFDADAPLIFNVGAGAIANYDGLALTAQVHVTGSQESVVASTAVPLTEATLDGSVVTLTLSGRKFARSIFDIRDAVTVSGIDGVTIPWHEPDKKSDTEITVELEFDGNINADSTLTFTIGVGAIAGYNGPALTAQITVTAIRENALLANFPNPFNPETWIPYQLSKPTEVTITIYAVNGQVVRMLTLGHQPAGIYQSRSRAAHWDGRNAFGEPVASGLYFYTLTAGDFTVTRKMLIRK